MNWFSKLFGKRSDAAPSSAGSPRMQTMNPKNLLFSIPTLADDLAALEPIDKPPTRGDVVLNEDDWAQLEFFPPAARPTVQQHLTELKAFEAANRKASGWKKVYVRKIQRLPVVPAPNPLRRLESVLGAKAGGPAFITSSNAIAGRVKRGFSFDLGGNIQLYGYAVDNGIPILAASVGPKADNMKLASAFMKLHKSDGVMLVDWRAQLLLAGVSKDGNIETWRP
jgi:hypothetical protein